MYRDVRELAVAAAKLTIDAPPSIAHHLSQAVQHLNAAAENARLGERQRARFMPRHRPNPELVIFNPPGRPNPWGMPQRLVLYGTLSREAHELRYQHAEDGKTYKHPFESEVHVLAVTGVDGRRDILLTSPRGLPLWEDF